MAIFTPSLIRVGTSVYQDWGPNPSGSSVPAASVIFLVIKGELVADSAGVATVTAILVGQWPLAVVGGIGAITGQLDISVAAASAGVGDVTSVLTVT